MLFNSIHFAIFLPIVFFLYWFVRRSKLQFQNLVLLVSSYFFYACWDYRFLFLLIFSTLLNYYSGIKIFDSRKLRIKRLWFWISIILNIGFLGIFKYYNFFIQSFINTLTVVGIQSEMSTLQIILPIGISFYTFHGLSYIIDLYKVRIQPERNAVNYSVFVCFFPLLVAGPIERATHLLPQIRRKREFDYSVAVNGLRQILWGLFKKIIVADNCAEYANMIFNNSSNYSSGILLLGAVFFAIQIYGDFSGYSDIAIGTARLFGIDLLRNFAFPYFSRDIAEFWRRWHISLSSWFRDYLYIPLGGSRVGTWMKVRNTFIIFLVSGFWHGANWTFIMWGFLHALYIMPSILFKTNRNNLDIVAAGRVLPSIREFISMCITFLLTVIAWIFFRAENITHAFTYIGDISSGIVSKQSYVELYNFLYWQVDVLVIILILFFILIEWIGRESEYALQNIALQTNRIYRYMFYYAIIIIIIMAAPNQQEFIYFQF